MGRNWEALKKENDELRRRLQQAEAEARRQSAQQRAPDIEAWENQFKGAISEIAGKLLPPTDIADLSSLVLERAVALTGSTAGFAGYVHPQTGYLIAVSINRSERGEQGGERAIVHTSVIKEIHDLWSQVLQKRQPLLSNAAADDPRASAIPPSHIPLKRFLAVPATIHNQAVGLIAVANARHDYTGHDQDVAEQLAALYALALQSHWALERIYQDADRLKAISELSQELAAAQLDLPRVLTTLVTSVGRMMADTCGIHLLAEDDQYLTTAALYNADPERQNALWRMLQDSPLQRDYGMTGRVFSTCKAEIRPVVNRDEYLRSLLPRYRREFERSYPCTILMVPLRLRGQVMGVLAASREHPDDPYTQDDADFLQTLADRAALSIANARLYANNLRENELLEARVAEHTEKLLQSERNYRTVVDQSPLGIVLVIDNRIVLCNEKEAQLFGYSRPEELIGRLTSAFVHREDFPKLAALAIDIRAGKSMSRPVIFRGVHRDGHEILIEAVAISFDLEGQDCLLSYHADVTERERASERLAFLAGHDSLTALPNRALFHDRLNHALTRAHREGSRLAVLLIDLDHFKEINDSLGHAQGDVALIEIAARLKDCLRASDTVARMGGDEFTIILENLENPAACAAIGDKILAAVQKPVRLEGKDFILTASIGVSLYPADGADADALLKNADIAMYRAKHQRGCLAFYSA
jgi:diguanylate cyclase (GGDEF)-like protein/PAS domain S-box-containing protein